MLHTIAISGYRSIKNLVLPLENLTVITGENGTGKSSFYRALRLLGEVAQGRAISSLAAEGGLSSTLWAGPETLSRAMRAGEVPIQGTPRKDRVSLKLGFAAKDYGYAIDLGLPTGGSAFALDPEIKAESVWIGDYLTRRNELAHRAGPLVIARNASGTRQTLIETLAPYDSMMTHAADPRDLSELLVLRQRMQAWRFYDHFRTDREAPSRRAMIGTRTPALSADGSDLAAALETVREIGDHERLDAAIEDAFPGARIEIRNTEGRFEVLMHQHGLLRPLLTAELSDGTLRYLLLTAALLTPRPPEIIVLNEPETSLHPRLLAPLGRLIADAARQTQILVVSHAGELVDALRGEKALSYELVKNTGETMVADAEELHWEWPSRR